MDRHTESWQVRRLEVVETGRRRCWTPEAKLRIVAESFEGPRLASATARRHGISGSLLFAWRKAFREGRLTDAAPVGFAPAVIVDEASAAGTPPAEVEDAVGEDSLCARPGERDDGEARHAAAGGAGPEPDAPRGGPVSPVLRLDVHCHLAQD
jgi:transposase